MTYDPEGPIIHIFKTVEYMFVNNSIIIAFLKLLTYSLFFKVYNLRMRLMSKYSQFNIKPGKHQCFIKWYKIPINFHILLKYSGFISNLIYRKEIFVPNLIALAYPVRSLSHFQQKDVFQTFFLTFLT